MVCVGELFLPYLFRICWAVWIQFAVLFLFSLFRLMLYQFSVHCCYYYYRCSLSVCHNCFLLCTCFNIRFTYNFIFIVPFIHVFLLLILRYLQDVSVCLIWNTVRKQYIYAVCPSSVFRHLVYYVWRLFCFLFEIIMLRTLLFKLFCCIYYCLIHCAFLMLYVFLRCVGSIFYYTLFYIFS